MSLPFKPFQAEVEGQKVTWLTPHALQQVMPQDVDYKIMLTFLEFYEVCDDQVLCFLYEYAVYYICYFVSNSYLRIHNFICRLSLVLSILDFIIR